ncbi:hypothetical protein [Sphingomonas immobilis]|uniref:J domain-containing protein n=1 Tax=Sphingomonas immobilis TaxID=3063997 RepID=A0ABT8ZVT5_9SPHN|nr:hypothetical protein [Sphingomonas sp. CA1-15]MDO7841679.1 hypothetical protein [Sphingomonas sp. CA1-15]
MTIWEILGLPAGSDRAAIRRGYAKKLRETHPEDDPEGFKELRAAYEMALAYADGRVFAGDENEDGAAGFTMIVTEGELATMLDAHAPEPERPTFATESSGPEPEIDALLAEREADIAALNDLLGKLDAGLRGPWAGDDRVLVATFEQVMRANAMGEISVRDDVEHWIAHLIATTIPRSDAILAQAARAFGWVQDRQSGLSPAVARAIERLDEWAVIENLGRDSHPLHPAWNTLTRPAGAYWSWRIDAFRPGMETGVETLLGERGPITPGLAHSFKADSVARWQAFLARPHVTLGMFAAIPLMLVVFFAMQNGLGKPVAAIAPYAIWAPLLAILAPIAPFVARLLRRTWLAAPRPAVLQEGWVAGIGVVFLAAAFLPPHDWALWPLAGAAALVWLWMSVAGGSADLAEIKARLRGGWIVAIGCLFAVPIGLVTSGGSRVAALTITAALALSIAAGPLRQAAEIGARRLMPNALGAVVLAAVYAVIAFAASRLYVPLGFTKLFYPAALTLLFGLLVTSAARLTATRTDGDVRIVRFLKIALVALFAGIAIFATTEIKPVKRSVTVPVATQEGDEAADDNYSGSPLRDRIATALATDPHADRAIEQLHGIAAFRQIADGNPALDAQIAAVVRARGDASGADEAAADRIMALVTTAYAARLPDADDGLLREELRIRAARLRALRAISPETCLSLRTALEDPVLPTSLRARATAHVFNVASGSGPSTNIRFDADPYSASEVAALAGEDGASFARALAGSSGPAAQCDARIAMAEALERAPVVERLRRTIGRGIASEPVR